MLQIEKHLGGPIADAVLRNMFAARKSVFIDLLKWDLPALAGLYELDQFDGEQCHYLILTDPDGHHLGSARLLPTCRPHILDSFYADLCAGPPPRGPEIFEITRFCLDRRLRAAERRQVRDALIIALVDHALAAGITHYSAVAEKGWSQQIIAFGWRCLPLGRPQYCDGGLLTALCIEISAQTPRLLADAGIIGQSAIAMPQSRAAA